MLYADVNECGNSSLNLCTFTDSCLNTVGSYNCSCPIGYLLENDGRTCSGKKYVLTLLGDIRTPFTFITISASLTLYLIPCSKEDNCNCAFGVCL